jgi:hypothetical protein
MTSSLADLFDVYSLRARVYPGFLAMLPLVITVYTVWDPPGLQKLWPLFMATGGTFFLANLVRSLGNKAEKRLLEGWNGWPTTHALRIGTCQNAMLRDRRRMQLEKISGIELPSLTEERTDPRKADDAYYVATRILVGRVRKKPDLFPRVQEENIHFGFRRNLYALKPIALVVVAISAGASIVGALADGVHWPVILSASSALILMLAWVFAVNPEWVWQAGEKYAERLFESMEDPAVLE